MNNQEFSINFSGLTHDHTLDQSTSIRLDGANDNTCSTIAILRRHPMYDCLVLVKKYRDCLSGYSLEFPSDEIQDEQFDDENCGSEKPISNGKVCGRRRLVSRFLDGDDPIYQSCCADVIDQNSKPNSKNPTGASLAHPFSKQLDDRGDTCELVHVPINGLLDRLKSYTKSNCAVDSRVYAFAMGLKTAERILTTGALKELQETPI